jgi:maleylacetate reductase
VTPSFTYAINTRRILFGLGMLDAVAEEIPRLGAKRALILSTPFQRADAQRLTAQTGPQTPA